MKYSNSLLRSIPLILFASLIMSACSGKLSDVDSFIDCNNGMQPTPIEQEFKLPGELLFLKRDRSEILSWNGETHEFSSVLSLPDDGSHDVSPLSQDGKTLVISHRDSSDAEYLSIILLSNRGSTEHRKALLPTLESNRNINISWSSVDWANDSYLQGVLYEEGNTGDELWESWLLNPYQPEWKSLSGIVEGLNQAKESGFLISPDLTRVLYVNSQYQLILYDLTQNKTLWENNNFDGVVPGLTSPNLSDAIWSKDGEFLALPTTSENNTPAILILAQDGKIINSVNLGNHLHGLSWSKDEQNLSFYEDRCTTADCRDKATPVIQLISLKDNSLTDICTLPENTVPVGGIINNRIVWSPNRQFLAYSFWNAQTMQDGIVFQKIDDPDTRILQIDNEDLILLGWSEYHWTGAKLQP